MKEFNGKALLISVSNWTVFPFCPSKTAGSFKTAKATQKHWRKWRHYCTMKEFNGKALFISISDWTAFPFCPSKTAGSPKIAKAFQKHSRKWKHFCTMSVLNESVFFLFCFRLNCSHILPIQNSHQLQDCQGLPETPKKMMILLYNDHVEWVSTFSFPFPIELLSLLVHPK